MSDSEYTTVVVHGSWSKFKVEGEWHKFEIDIPGAKYPVKASSKRSETVEQMLALRDQDATFTLAEKDSKNINEHTGKPYKDRYVSKVEAGFIGEPTSSSQSSGGATAGGGGSARYTEDDLRRIDEKDRRDFASRAWAQTIAAFEHRVGTDVEDHEFFVRLQAFQRKIYYDVTGEWGERDDSYLPEALRGARGTTSPGTDATTSTTADEHKQKDDTDDIPF